MLILITYDVSTETAAGKRRLHKVAKTCLNYGQRVQASVFECVINTTQLKQLKIDIERIIDIEKDSVRYYYLGDEMKCHVEHMGIKKGLDLTGPLIV